MEDTGMKSDSEQKTAIQSGPELDNMHVQEFLAACKQVTEVTVEDFSAMDSVLKSSAEKVSSTLEMMKEKSVSEQVRLAQMITSEMTVITRHSSRILLKFPFDNEAAYDRALIAKIFLPKEDSVVEFLRNNEDMAVAQFWNVVELHNSLVILVDVMQQKVLDLAKSTTMKSHYDTDQPMKDRVNFIQGLFDVSEPLYTRIDHMVTKLEKSAKSLKTQSVHDVTNPVEEQLLSYFLFAQATESKISQLEEKISNDEQEDEKDANPQIDTSVQRVKKKTK